MTDDVLRAAERRMEARRRHPAAAQRERLSRQAARLRAEAAASPAVRRRTASHGVETRYGGTTYRSRIEARWACWFDLAGIWAEYEPIDLEGYVPDFILPHEWAGGPLLIEVKPSLYHAELWPAAEKIDLSGWNGAAMVVGARLWVALERPADGDWRISRGFPGHQRTAQPLWRQAGNRTQWRGRSA